MDEEEQRKNAVINANETDKIDVLAITETKRSKNIKKLKLATTARRTSFRRQAAPQ